MLVPLLRPAEREGGPALRCRSRPLLAENPAVKKPRTLAKCPSWLFSGQEAILKLTISEADELIGEQRLGAGPEPGSGAGAPSPAPAP